MHLKFKFAGGSAPPPIERRLHPPAGDSNRGRRAGRPRYPALLIFTLIVTDSVVYSRQAKLWMTGADFPSRAWRGLQTHPRGHFPLGFGQVGSSSREWSKACL